MQPKICPACGSADINETTKKMILSEPFVDDLSIRLSNDHCNICGASGDFLNSNEEVLEKSYQELKKEGINNILSGMMDEGFSLSSIERALDLPQRTLAKWKNKKANPSAAGLTLLRFIKLFPWLLEVAEHNYDSNQAQRIHTIDAINQFFSLVRPDALVPRIRYESRYIRNEFIFIVTGSREPQKETSNAITEKLWTYFCDHIKEGHLTP